ncbi:MAG: hypothetical protein JW754_01860 [Candidatus Aenigmarchaeota archaeon]|nr:hypothetical protein [Candidatus Aenigmarchaeota archaeon]
MTLKSDEESHKTKQPWKVKAMVLAGFAIMFILLIYSISYLFQTGENPLLLIVLILVTLVMIPVAIFSVDTAFYHYAWSG